MAYALSRRHRSGTRTVACARPLTESRLGIFSGHTNSRNVTKTQTRSMRHERICCAIQPIDDLYYSTQPERPVGDRSIRPRQARSHLRSVTSVVVRRPRRELGRNVGTSSSPSSPKRRRRGSRTAARIHPPTCRRPAVFQLDSPVTASISTLRAMRRSRPPGGPAAYDPRRPARVHRSRRSILQTSALPEDTRPGGEEAVPRAGSGPGR
jgi:hypothetical protein